MNIGVIVEVGKAGGTFWSTSSGIPSKKQSRTVSILSLVAANPPQGWTDGSLVSSTKFAAGGLNPSSDSSLLLCPVPLVYPTMPACRFFPYRII